MNRINHQRGAVAVLVAVMLILIFVCVALVVDMGHIHNVKVEMQKAVDAAALAGAQQLTGNANQVLYAKNVAVATAATNDVNEVTFISTDCVNSTTESCLGWWKEFDEDANSLLGEDASVRFEQSEDAPNAVLVRATRTVPHFFFFFLPSTDVTVDAIAVAEPVNPIMPLTLVSCIPLDSIQNNPGTLPGTEICDIGYYSYNPDTEDTGAWTSLTFNASANDIRAMLEGPEGRKLFEQAVFGRGNGGIENTAPLDSGLCEPHDLAIDCGLGQIAGMRLAPPELFEVPSGFPSPPTEIPRNPTTGVYQPDSGIDPMNVYRLNDALPRWYNLNADGVLKTDDHFVRLWSLDGLLLKAPNPGDPDLPPGALGENFAQYQARLKGYYDGTLIPPVPYNDGRLVGAAGLISNDLKQVEKQAIAARFPGVSASDVNYWPNALEILKRSGYPKVGVMNGTATALLDTFLENEEVATGTTLNCSENAPLTGNTLKLQVPVVFGGFCEQWKALSNPSAVHTLTYVGLADFLVTRVWKNPDDYACADNYVNGSACPGPWSPPLGGGGDFSAVNFNAKGIEGLVKVPLLDDAAASSIVKAFLVE